ncbi:hypothetical protein MNV49_007919 [Pseudohyphozyma bogoriensis]|nr:hypothetical protein MNV49_007919 [Pseudohyphozyma bogoriensis]
MPPTRLIAAAVILPVPAFLLQQHWRLKATYPSLPVSPAFEINARTDTPAVGMGETPLMWLQTSAGDQWEAIVPRRWLKPGQGDDLAEAFAKAFWSTWPLRLEGWIMSLAVRAGVAPFNFRGTTQVEGAFDGGARLLDGLFMVEAHDKHPKGSEMIDGPVIASWWTNFSPSPPTPRLLGGYHSFLVERLPTDSNNFIPSDTTSAEDEEQVRLVFASHAVLSPPIQPPANSIASPASTSLVGLSPATKVMMPIHHIYSRLLLDAAVKRLRSESR